MFDQIRLSVLIEIGLRLQFSLVLYLSLSTHGATRVLSLRTAAGTYISESIILVDHSTLAGCTFSVGMTRVWLFDILDHSTLR